MGASASPGEANRERAEHVLQRQAEEGRDARDMNPRWLLGAVREATPSEVVFARRPTGKGTMDTMGVAVLKDRPEQSALEIRGMFGPGMGTELFDEAAARARADGRRLLLADVVPGARDAYRARGFASAGGVGQDGAYPMSREILAPPPAESSQSPVSLRSQSGGALGSQASRQDPGRPEAGVVRSLGPRWFASLASGAAPEPPAMASQAGRREGPGPTWTSAATNDPLRTIRSGPLDSRSIVRRDAGSITGVQQEENEPGFWACVFPCLDRSWH